MNIQDWNYIFEEDQDLKNIKTEDLLVDDSDFVEFFKDHPDELKKFISGIEDSDMSDDKKKKLLNDIKKSVSKVNESLETINEVFLGITAAVVTTASIGLIHAATADKKKRVIVRYKTAIARETDEDKKKQLKQEFENYKRVTTGENNKDIITKHGLKKNIDRLVQKGKLPKDYTYDTYKEEHERLKKTIDDYNKSLKKPKDKDEETVKDKDGVEWIKRKKERGDGFTYCRKDDRSVTMSQEEYNKKNAQKNESLGMSLKDFIIESLN